MKNSNLICKATNCVHNSNCECMAGVISIRGGQATDVKETSCATFVIEGGYGLDNFSNYYDKSKTMPENIRCSAVNCRYNEERQCYAGNVQILAANSSCGTFEYNS